MKQIEVRTAVPYTVEVAAGLLAETGARLRAQCGGEQVCLVCDTVTHALYGDRVQSALETAGYRVCRFVFPSGEASKNAQTYLELVDFLAAHQITRSDVVAALGGGVTGDLAGFAAATYLRGISLVQLPTTLLAMVDSSVGGKTAIDLQRGKNLVGAFYQPSLVLCDTETLRTLPPPVFADGCAEVIKYGVLGNRSLFSQLEQAGPDFDREDVIAQCVAQKARLVEEDERDHGSRQLLNLGHTVGHAIELCSGLEESHGSAVAAGMAIVMRAAANAGLCDPAAARAVERLLKQFQLPTGTAFSAGELTWAALSDKKRRGDSLTLVLPRQVGDTVLHPVPIQQLEGFLRGGLEQ